MAPKAENAANSAIVRDLGDYKLEKQVLGEGAFGKVRLATSTRTSHRVAVKVIKRKKLNERAEVLLQRERRHHEKLRHPNIVRLHTFIMTPNKYYLVMEYCEGGDLLQYINSTTLLSDEHARSLFRGLIEGINFCHVLGIHHRDLKLENLMLTSRDERTMAIKIADFGLSDLQSLPSSLSATFCGSPLYAAPELMTAGAAPDGYDASKSDVWSCGVVLYALLSSALPFDAEDIQALVRQIQRGVPNSPVPESRGPMAAQLVGRMLTVDPKERPLAAEVLQQPWLRVEAKQIKTSVTTSALPQGAAAATTAASPLAPVDGGGAPRRRGATATTRFFKDLKDQVLLEEGGASEAGALMPAAPPAAAPPSEVAPPTQPPPAPSEPTQQPTQQPTAPPPTAPPVDGAPMTSAALAEASNSFKMAPSEASGSFKTEEKRQEERQKGKVLTKQELAEIKIAVANGLVEDPPDPVVPPPEEPEETPPVEPEPVPSEPCRKGGAPLTKDEWEEIRRERREAREAKERAAAEGSAPPP